jgi:hypothetical protein
VRYADGTALTEAHMVGTAPTGTFDKSTPALPPSPPRHTRRAITKSDIITGPRPEGRRKYHPEYAKAVAHDIAATVVLAESITAHRGSLRSCLQTKKLSLAEPVVLEYKSYARGGGQRSGGGHQRVHVTQEWKATTRRYGVRV